MSKKMRVINVGLSLKSPGGIANNQMRVMKTFSGKVSVKHCETVIADCQSSKFANALRFLRAVYCLLLECLEPSVDLVHLRMAQRGSFWRKMICACVARAFSIPVLMHAHGSEFQLFFRSLSPVFQRPVRWTLRRCDGLIVLSESWKEFYVNEVGVKAERVFVLPNHVLLPTEVPDRSGRTRLTFVFLGRIGRRKGAFDLISSFSLLPEDLRASVKLVLAGDGEIAKAKKLADDLGCSTEIRVMGWIGNSEVEKLLEAADVFILPTYNEGMPLALLEAMGYGLPSISTPVGGIPEILVDGRTGIMVEPGRTEEICQAMKRLILDEAFRLRLGAEARRSVEPLEISQYVKRLEDIYRRVIARSQSEQ